jgi:hypothetical protein
MRRITTAFTVLGVVALVVAAVPAVGAQGEGGQGKSSMTSQQGRRGQKGQRGQGNQRDQGLSDQQRQRIRADQQQARQLQSCTGMAAGIQSRARKMAQAGKRQGQSGNQGQGQAGGQARGRAGGQGQGQAGGQGQGFDPAQIQATGAQIRDRVQDMLREHDQLMQGLSDEQESLLRDQTRDLSRTRERLQDCVEGLDQAIGAASPDPERVGERAGELARVMDTLQQQYRRLAEDMSMQLETMRR